MLTTSAKVVLCLVALAGLGTVMFPENADAAAILGIVLGVGYSGVTAMRRSRLLEDREQAAWRLIGVGFATSALGVATGVAIAVVTGTVPDYGYFDLITLTGYLFLMAGLTVMPSDSGIWLERARRVIDGLVVAFSVGAIAGVLALDDIIAGLANAPPFERFVGMSYPLLDTASVVTVSVVLVRRRKYRFDIRLILLALGLAIQATADMSFLTSGVATEDASPYFLAFILAAGLYVVATTMTDRLPAVQELSDRHAPVWALILPYGAAIWMFGILALHLFTGDDRHMGWLFVVTFVTLALIFLRQALAIRENRILVERERNSLISSISHELRTPLTSLVGFLSLLDDDGDLLSARERIDMIAMTRQQADYMGRMVTDFVMLARDDLDQITITPSAEMLGDLVERSVVSADVPRQGLDVEVRSSLMVSVDSDRLQQVLVNLLTNAVRYGSGKVTITAVERHRDLFISVHDDGAGVPKKHQITMWDRFERAHHRFDASAPGSGIGLAIVSSLVTAHGGRVSYRRSEILGGACFMVELPGAVLPDTPAEHHIDAAPNPQVALGS